MPCRRLTSAAALARKTPPYSPSQCIGLRRKGGDGFMYISHQTPSGRYHWTRASKPRRKLGVKPGPGFVPQNAPNAPNPNAAGYKAGLEFCRQSRNVAKYANRKSPSFSAQSCRGMVLKGKDVGTFFQSTPNRNGVYRWIKVKPNKIRKIEGLQHIWY